MVAFSTTRPSPQTLSSKAFAEIGMTLLRETAAPPAAKTTVGVAVVMVPLVMSVMYTDANAGVPVETT